MIYSGASQLCEDIDHIIPVAGCPLHERVQSKCSGKATQPEKISVDARRFENDCSYEFGTLWNLDTHKLLDRHGVGGLVDVGFRNANPWDQPKVLQIQSVFHEFLKCSVKVPRIPVSLNNSIALKLKMKREVSMYARMIWPNVQFVFSSHW